VLRLLTADPWLVAIAEVAVVPLVAIVCISICVCTRKIRMARFDFELKRDMLQRGMSAEDIRTVIEAGRAGHTVARPAAAGDHQSIAGGKNSAIRSS
jgi:hypothetical protein